MRDHFIIVDVIGRATLSYYCAAVPAVVSFSCSNAGTVTPGFGICAISIIALLRTVSMKRSDYYDYPIAYY